MQSRRSSYDSSVLSAAKGPGLEKGLGKMVQKDSCPETLHASHAMEKGADPVTISSYRKTLLKVQDDGSGA